jgi:hypothetical protein
MLARGILHEGGIGRAALLRDSLMCDISSNASLPESEGKYKIGCRRARKRIPVAIAP